MHRRRLSESIVALAALRPEFPPAEVSVAIVICTALTTVVLNFALAWVRWTVGF